MNNIKKLQKSNMSETEKSKNLLKLFNDLRKLKEGK
jgi:hypothetical protein